MSFLKVFNSCCPFLLAPPLEVEDDFYENVGDYELDFDGMTDESKQKFQRKRFGSYMRGPMHILNNNDKRNNLTNRSRAIADNANVSNMVVNDILNKIVY